jgi:anti-sigma factor RsiW
MTHVHEDIGAFILGALDTDAEKRVREHLATCQQCAAAHAELAGIPGLLDLAVVTGATEDEPLPPAIEERLLDRFARERVEPPSSRRRWRPRLALGVSSALAGAAIAIAALILGLNFQRNGGRPPSQYRLAFEKVGNAPVSAGASARAGLRTTESGTVVRLWVENLPADDVYEVFCDAPGWSASAGTFRVDAKGDAYVILTTAVKKGQYDRIRLVRREHLANGDVVPADILTAKLS